MPEPTECDSGTWIVGFSTAAAGARPFRLLCHDQAVSTHRHVRTARLTLDATTAADLKPMFELHSDPEVWHPPSRQHRDLAQTAQFLLERELDWADGGLGYWVARTLVDVPHGPAATTLIGIGGCARRHHTVWNLYYRLSPAAWGHGFATEIAGAARAAAAAVDPQLPVVAYLLERNTGSRRTAERVGLTLAWRGPDQGNPDPAAVRLIYADRHLSSDVVDQLTSTP